MSHLSRNNFCVRFQLSCIVKGSMNFLPSQFNASFRNVRVFLGAYF